MGTVHSGAFAFECGACGFATNDRSHIDVHLANNATHRRKKREFACSFCSYRYVTGGDSPS
jgi:uncharacterized ferredoxin-like protein